MGKSIKNQIPWTKGLYYSFLDDAILTELEKKVLHARVMESDKWTITRMALEFNAGGNYGAKEDGLKDLDAMLHYNYKLIKYIKETATSPEEQEIVRKHFSKAKELMNV